MYKCTNCDTVYDLSDDHLNYIGKECKENDISKTIVVCPGCEKERIVGGEKDFDEYIESDCILMFGYEMERESDVSKFKIFRGVGI